MIISLIPVCVSTRNSFALFFLCESWLLHKTKDPKISGADLGGSKRCKCSVLKKSSIYCNGIINDKRYYRVINFINFD